MPTIWEITLLSSSLISALYFLLFRIGFGRYVKSPEGKTNVNVSVIIAAHNELYNLQNLIPSLLGQQHESFEVVIANDRSTDGTAEFLASISDPKLKCINIADCPSDINPKKNALTIAIKESKNPFLVLTDADCLPLSDQWISKMTGPYNKDTHFVIGYSGYKRYPGFLNQFIRYETLFTAIQYIGLGLFHRPYMGVGRNLSYTKEVFSTHNGFSDFQHITGGDDDLFVNRHASGSNTAFVLESNAQTISEPKRSWKSYFRQKTRHLSVGKHYIGRDQLILGAFSVANLIFWVTFVYIGITGDLVFALAAYVLRLGTLSLTFTTARGILQERHTLWTLPVMDVFYWIYHSFTAALALVVKRTKWN